MPELGWREANYLISIYDAQECFSEQRLEDTDARRRSLMVLLIVEKVAVEDLLGSLQFDEWPYKYSKTTRSSGCSVTAA